jgi:hypothetical protein
VKTLIFLLLAIAAATAGAQDIDDDSPPQLRMVVGNGDSVSAFDASGSGWSALACDAQGCALEPARVDTRNAAAADNAASSGSDVVKLVRVHPDTRAVVAWLQAPSGWPLAWLRPGPVPTYGLGSDGFQRPHTAGTYELSVSRGGKEIARMVPMVDPKAKAYVLQLRVGDLRQVFDHALWQCTGSGGSNYLLWAGDLDRDGQPDYLVNFLDEDSDDPLAGRGYIVLYLSRYAGTSRAGDDDLVGVGAEYEVYDRTDCPGVPASVFSHLTPVADTPTPSSTPHPAPGTQP